MHADFNVIGKPSHLSNLHFETDPGGSIAYSRRPWVIPTESRKVGKI